MISKLFQIVRKTGTARGTVVPLVFIFMLCAGCAGGRISGPGSTSDLGTGSLDSFQKAETFYRGGQLDEALAAFTRFFQRWPETPQAQNALIYIGDIHYRKKNYEAAIESYEKMAAKYPHSKLVPEARYKIIASYYSLGRYQVVVRTAENQLRNIQDPKFQFGAGVLLGDSHMALGEPLLAIEPYGEVYALALGKQQTALVDRIGKAVALLDPSSFPEVMAKSKGCLVEGMVLLRMATDALARKESGPAGEAAEALVKRCPSHPRVDKAHEVLASLENLSNFKSNEIGCLLPLSGKYAEFGDKVLSGVNLAMEQYNSWHREVPVNLVIRDTAGDPALALKGLRELAAAGVCAVIGPMITAAEIKDAARELGVPAIVFTQKAQAAERGGYLFRNYITPSMQASALASYGVKELGIRKYAILHPDDDYGKTFMREFWDQLALLGAEVTAVGKYAGTETDFAEHIKRMKSPLGAPGAEAAPVGETGGEETEQAEETASGGVDFGAVFIPDTPEQAGLVLPQFPYHDIRDMVFFGTNLWHSEQLIEAAGQYAEGAVVPEVFFTNSADPKAQSFVRDYFDTYRKEPDFLAALGYDSANILFTAAHQSGVRNRERLRSALLQTTGYPGITGRTTFYTNGEVHKELTLLKVAGGLFVPVHGGVAQSPQTESGYAAPSMREGAGTLENSAPATRETGREEAAPEAPGLPPSLEGLETGGPEAPAGDAGGY
jgi:ABC-type branched-subunit amino acid transport system substrate-binding protein